MSPLYAITDPLLLPGPRLLTGVAAALAGGCRLVQYRDKTATAAERLDRALRLQDLVSTVGGRLIINDDVELAQRVGAAGVHLGQGDGDPRAARSVLGDLAIIGVTCHASLDLARTAAAAGASYVAFGRFFPSRTKPDAPPAPLELLARARRELKLPTVAIGGISLANMAPLVVAGASSLACCEAVFGAPDIEARTRALLRAIQSIQQADQ